MKGQPHRNIVLYKTEAMPGHKYRQIVVIENEQYEVRIFEGDVISTEPEFLAHGSDAEIYFHTELSTALNDAQEENNRSLANGWIPYSPY